MEAIRFTVKLNKEEWLSFSKVVSRRLTRLAKANSKLFIVNLWAWMPLGFAMAAYSAMYRKYPFLTEDLSVVGGSVVIGAVLLVFSLLIRNRIYRKVMVADNGSVLAEHEFKATPSELCVTGPFGSSVYPWGCLIDHVEENRVVYLFTGNAQALVTPIVNISTEKDVASLRGWISAEQS